MRFGLVVEPQVAGLIFTALHKLEIGRRKQLGGCVVLLRFSGINTQRQVSYTVGDISVSDKYEELA
jgi:hypothetical protein